MKRSTDRILTTHVGSLIRPKSLLDHAPEAREQELKRSVADIVARQASAGIDIVNDGEFGKSGWANYVLERITGFEPRPDTLYPAVWLGRDRERFAEFMAAEFPRGVKGSAGSRLRRADHLSGSCERAPRPRQSESRGGRGAGGGHLLHRRGARKRRL